MDFVNSLPISNAKLQKLIESPYNYLLTKKRSFLRKENALFAAESFKNVNSLFKKVSTITNNGQLLNSNRNSNLNFKKKISLIHFRKKSIPQNNQEIKIIDDERNNSKNPKQKFDKLGIKFSE